MRIKKYLTRDLTGQRIEAKCYWCQCFGEMTVLVVIITDSRIVLFCPKCKRSFETKVQFEEEDNA